MATITVGPSGRDFTTIQAAVNAAAAGDTVVCDAGVTFAEAVTLPTTQHATPVRVTSSGTLPSRRVAITDAGSMATIEISGGFSAITGVGVKGWTFDFIRIAFTGGSYVTQAAVEITNANLGGGSFRNSDNITFDRCLIQGGASGCWRHGIIAHGSGIIVTRCCIENIRNTGNESKGFLMIDGPGPVEITDNFIEAAAINILFGGGDQSSAAHIPNDILVEGNHLFKRLSWLGQGFAVKNLFELKCATNVVVQNNLMENSWTDGQVGYGVLFTSRNDEDHSPWATVQNVTFTANVVRGTERGCQFLGLNDGSETVRATNVTLSNNLFICSNNWGLGGGEFGTLTIEHNTIVNGGTLFLLTNEGLVWDSGGQRATQFSIDNLIFRNNLCYHREFGVFLSGDGIGTSALDNATNAYTWTHNILAGATTQTYPNSTPTSTWYPTVAAHEANFNADYTLKDTSTYNNAGSDSLDLGWFGGNAPPGGGEPPPTGGGTITGYGVQHISTTWSPQDINTTVTHTFTVASEPNSILLVRFPYFGPTELVTGVTTNPNGSGAVTLIKLIDYLGSNSRRVAIWYKVAPTAGSNVVSVTMSEAQGNALGVSQYSRVHQTRPFGSIVTAGSSGTMASVNVYSLNPYALIVDAIRWAFSESRSAVPAQGQAQRFYEVAAAGSDRLVTIPITTMTWTIDDGGADWALVGVPLMPIDTMHQIIIRNKNTTL